MPPHLAPGFNIIQAPESDKTGIPILVRHLPEYFEYGIKDVDWIPKVGKLKACIITRDTNLSRRKHELELLRNHGIGIFFLKAKNKKSGFSIWEMVEMLAKSWQEITKIAVDEKRPFGYEVNFNGKLKKIF